MPAIFIDQPYKLELDTEVSQATATNPNISYRKPSGTTGTWPGTIDGENIFYIVTSSDNDESGTWKFQAASTFSGYSGETRGRTYEMDVLSHFGA